MPPGLVPELPVPPGVGLLVPPGVDGLPVPPGVDGLPAPPGVDGLPVPPGVLVSLGAAPVPPGVVGLGVLPGVLVSFGVVGLPVVPPVPVVPVGFGLVEPPGAVVEPVSLPPGIVLPGAPVPGEPEPCAITAPSRAADVDPAAVGAAASVIPRMSVLSIVSSFSP
jgi:hypothetical protein